MYSAGFSRQKHTPDSTKNLTKGLLLAGAGDHHHDVNETIRPPLCFASVMTRMAVMWSMPGLPHLIQQDNAGRPRQASRAAISSLTYDVVTMGLRVPRGRATTG